MRTPVDPHGDAGDGGWPAVVALLDAWPDGAFLAGSDGRILHGNTEVRRILGPVVDKRCFETVHGRASVCDWCPRGEAASSNSDGWSCCPDGGRQVSARPVPLPDGGTGTLFRVARPPADSPDPDREELDRILASVSAYIWSARLAPTGRLETHYVSPGVRGVTGRKPGHYADGAGPWLETVHEDDRPRMAEAIERATSGPPGLSVEDYRIHRPDGAIRWMRDSVVSRIEADGSRRLDGVVADVTDLHDAEEKRRRLEEHVLHTQKLESLGVLAGGIAHDFNNLLQGILGNADLALANLEPRSPVVGNLLEIVTCSRRAAELSLQMLAYSGKGRYVLEPIRLSLFVERTAKLLETAISRKANLLLRLRPNLPPVEADAGQVRQVLLNLVTNASESLRNGPGLITVETGEETCDGSDIEAMEPACLVGRETAPRPGPYVFLQVEDQGSGMSSDVRARVFDPFFTTQFVGRGLGMAAVLGIVRGHGGAIRIDTEEGSGTRVRILLPARPDLDGEPARA